MTGSCEDLLDNYLFPVADVDAAGQILFGAYILAVEVVNALVAVGSGLDSGNAG